MSKPDASNDGHISDYQWLKGQGFNSLADFALSYGYKPTPEGLESAKVIMGTFRQNDPGTSAGQWYKAEVAAGRQPSVS